MRYAPLFLIALGCSEYDLTRSEDAEGGESRPLDTCEGDAPGPEAIDADPTCEMEPQTGQFVPELQWGMSSFQSYGGSNSIMSTPVVAHITDDDGDGVYGSAGDTPDIAVITYGSSNVLRVLSGDGLGEHWSVADDPQGQGIPAVGDLDGDGDPEIVVITNKPTAIAYRNDGTKLWESEELGDGNWLWPTLYVAEYCSAPAISDMDGDGQPEVIAGSVILNGANGQTLGIGVAGKGTSSANGDVGTTSFAVDIDLDGQQEVIVGNAIYTRTGALERTSNEEDGFVAVGDFDSDPEGEIVVVRPGTVSLYNHDFSKIWGPVSIGSSMGGPPTVADFDGDGEPEIGIAGASIYTVIETDGSVLWSRPTQDGTSGITGSSVYDFEGDGIAEVVYADEVTLWVFNGPDGAVKLEYTDHASNTWLEYPTVADVDGDGHAEIILGHNPYQGGKEVYGISVIGDSADTWTDTREIWNQHAYHITNVEDDGGIPADAEINWERYNNFRSGDLFSGSGSAAADLVGEIVGICEDGCADGELLIYGRVRNEGAAEAPAGVELALFNDVTLLELAEIADPIPAGEASAAVLFTVDPLDVDAGFSVYADPNGGIPECDEDNNEDAWTDGICL